MVDPMYRQIADDLHQKIKSGELAPGDQLPTELELRALYGNASRNTVRDAVKWLITRGLVETRQGHGTFVVPKFDPFITTLDIESGFGDRGGFAYESEVKARSRTPEVSPPKIEILQVSGTLASDLQLPEGTSVVSRHQQRFIDGTPWSLQTSFYPMKFVEDGAADLLKVADMPHGVVRYIEDVLGIRQVGWRDRITSRAPDTTESGFFKLPDDGRVALFEIQRTAFGESANPLRHTITVYPADRNQFVLHVGKVPREPGTTAQDPLR
jgi:GntR family transcriptional regulator